MSRANAPPPSGIATVGSALFDENIVLPGERQ